MQSLELEPITFFCCRMYTSVVTAMVMLAVLVHTATVIPGAILVPWGTVVMTQSTWAMGFTVDLRQIQQCVGGLQQTLDATANKISKGLQNHYSIQLEMRNMYHSHHRWLQIKLTHLNMLFTTVHALTTSPKDEPSIVAKKWHSDIQDQRTK